MEYLFYLVYESTPEDNYPTGANYPRVGRHLATLDQWAIQRDLTPLGTFVVNHANKRAWFPATLGLMVVDALAMLLNHSPNIFTDTEGITGELTTLADELAVAEQNGVRFHIATS